MSRDLGQDVPESEKLCARELCASDFPFSNYTVLALFGLVPSLCMRCAG